MTPEALTPSTLWLALECLERVKLLCIQQNFNRVTNSMCAIACSKDTVKSIPCSCWRSNAVALRRMHYLKRSHKRCPRVLLPAGVIWCTCCGPGWRTSLGFGLWEVAIRKSIRVPLHTKPLSSFNTVTSRVRCLCGSWSLHHWDGYSEERCERVVQLYPARPGHEVELFKWLS